MNKLKSLLLVLLMGVSTVSWAQTTVTGTVLDEQNVPLPGANVVVKNTTNGVVTDFDGNFSISVSNTNAVLVISYIGYVGKEIKLDGSSSYTITLEEDATGLEEVVVIGYGSVKRTDLTGAVASLDAQAITEQKKTDISQALQGRVAGVDVRANNNKPGAPISIDIRGNTVIQNTNETRDGLSDDLAADLSSPLYVVDGVFFDDINILNPADIQQIDILKDASATAIYGSRGANGVVIITTKNGVEGRTIFTYETTVGINSVANKPDMYNGDEFVGFVEDVIRSRNWQGLFNFNTPYYPTVDDYNNTPVDFSDEFRSSNEEADNVANRRYTDWQNDYIKTGIQTSHNLGMSGGRNGLTYNGSIGYLSNEGVMGIEKFDRYNLNTSITKKVSDKFTVGLKAYLSLSERETGSNELFRSTLRLSPTVNPRDPDGNLILFPDDQDGRFTNPYYEAYEDAWLNNTRTLDVIANVFMQYQPAKWISFKTQFAPNLRTIRHGQQFGLLTKSARNEAPRTRQYYDAYFNTSYSWDNIVDLNFDIAEGHNLKTTLISSVYYRQDESSKIETRNFDTDAYKFYNTAAGLDVYNYATDYEKETLSSFAGRLNYSIEDKYLFTFTGRYDGSSKLAVGHEWAFFPSAAFAWKASEENFLQDVDWLSNLKLRLSYGESGNDNVAQPYQSLAFLNGADYVYGSDHINGVQVAGLANYDLTWERSKEYNFGLDLGILNNRVRLGLEVYNKKTVDAILGKTLSSITGYSTAIGNYGSVSNKGVEITLNTTNIQTQNFKWTTSLNYARNKNEILELDGGIDKLPYGDHGVRQIGEPVDAIYSYKIEGIWQLDEAAEAHTYNAFPGEWKYADLNNDGVLNQDDNTVIGSISPDWIGGMTNTFAYKNLDLSVQMHTRQGTFGHSEFYNNFAPWQNDQAKFNKVDLDYWSPNNQDAKYPAASYASTGNDYYTSFDFVKIGNIGLGYNASEALLDKLKMSSLRLTLDFQNPFTFTDYAGPDPETGLNNTYNAGYMIKTVLLGLKLSY
ncbi:SusC/RagA family TonB-linked outer membrane protein [Arenibacter palladensis]|uniref:SusC/RagA family TonB-linked outer membrane protein n=1 Tax=Arenibacter palladensis TaxID=237373 RepID=UPI0026E3761F|nr:TonB-dependent receptor [Arenibacter palladensis]MDO6602092.1 TonB-dependent receptor [Arenibacter palladensis]|tara:strand:+ start:137 stop:3214 length:3078 start_codon:yes stop_codon:yes gene_type:complete